ncbi:MAG TPA: PAS domain S-box protein [Gemmatimonadales bacterium]|nr:PAS domain S-box protein [Gemmatimonadales bacterium]
MAGHSKRDRAAHAPGSPASPEPEPPPDRTHPATSTGAGAQASTDGTAEGAPVDGAERFWHTFRDAPIGIAHSTLTGRWLEVNQFVLNFLGYSRDELKQRTIRDVTHPDDIPEDEAGHRRLVAGLTPSHRMEKRFIRNDGGVVWSTVTDSLARTAQGEAEYVISVIDDITERKRTEAQLRELSVLLEEAERTAHVGAWAWYLATDTVTFTDEVLRLYGLERLEEPFTLETIFARVHPDDRDSMWRALWEATQNRAGFAHEFRVVWPGGIVRTLYCQARIVNDANGDVRCMLGSTQDITERKQAAAQLEVSEQRYRSLFDYHPDAVYSLDLEGRFRSVNPACERVSGYRPDEVLGQTFEPLVTPECREQVLAGFRGAVNGVARTFDAAILAKDGRRVDFTVINIPIVVRGEVVGVFGIAKDVTAQHALEAQLQQAQRLEAIGQLAGGIAHDFNNLLAAILANSELALAEARTAPLREEVEEIRQTAVRATALTRQLLAFSRNQVVRPRIIDPNTVVQDAERMLRRVLGSRAGLRVDLGQVGPVLADPGQLEQALLNLVINARDAMPAGGTVQVRTRDLRVDEAFAEQHQALQPGAYVALSVADTGTGIPTELHGRIFEPFFTTKPIGQGSGLGLAMVYGFVKQWGGTTVVESAPNAGATFTIYLPRQQGTPALPSDRKRTGRPGGHETVLVVEDETAVRNAIRRILAGHGYTVLEARHGVEALRVIEQAVQPIDLIVTDVAMPEMDGRELIANLQRRNVPAKLLVISGYDAQGALTRASLPPGAQFLSKPFSVEALLQSARAALDAGAAPLGD